MIPPGTLLSALAEQYGLRDVYVFGSRAAEIRERVEGADSPSLHPESDVDIAVEPRVGRTLSARDRVQVADHLESMFNAPRVDVVILSEAPPLLAVEVIRGELLYTTDPLAQAEQELYILRRAADLAPFQRERVQAILTGSAR